MESKLLKLATKFDLIVSAKKTTSRKQLQKQLDKTRTEYVTLQKSYNQLSTEAEQIQKKLTETKSKLDLSRANFLELTKYLQTMDLAGASAFKQHGQDVSYSVDGKDFYVDTSDVNDVKYTPWKEYRKSKPTESEDSGMTELPDGSGFFTGTV